ncbi:hypothetical protein [Halopiger djelfimassiliensis]|uniref:hypothetical protein n=1 Tax=Halopiger djelfimassiliensis TaxID=1293047 RepID=UPI000677E85F|nr:hypothetical protein [Halopiger djelfimassiliensis]
MAEGSKLKQVVAEEVSDQVGVAELLGEGNVEDEIDGGEIGASVGRQFGERIGRELGAAIGRNVHETLSQKSEDETDRNGTGSALVEAVREGVSETFEDSSTRESLESLARSATEETSLEGVLERDEAADAEGGERETEAEAEESADEPEPEPEAGDGEGEDEPSAAELEDLKRETLEDFLGVMSYQDLQSVAKDVGVKANLSREEMTDEIIEAVAGGDGESESDTDTETE